MPFLEITVNHAVRATQNQPNILIIYQYSVTQGTIYTCPIVI